MKKILLLTFIIATHLGFSLHCQANEKVDGILAVVNDDIITDSDFSKKLKEIKKTLSQSNEILPTDSQLKQQVIQHLVDITLQKQAAKQAGIHVNNKTVQEAILNIAKKNKMSLKQLKANLKQSEIEYHTYEKNIQEQMILSEIQKKMVSDKIKISPKAIEKAYDEAYQQQANAEAYHLKDVRLPLSESPSKQEIVQTKQYAEKIYQQLKSEHALEKIKTSAMSDNHDLDIIDLDWRPIKALPSVFVNAVKNLKINHYTQPIQTPNGYHVLKLIEKRSEFKPHFTELTHVRHILLRVPESDPNHTVKKRIDLLHEKLKQHNAFGQIAHAFSEDVGSAEKSGDLGWVRNNDLVPAFSKAMRQLQVNQISVPIRSEFGWHIIQVLGRKKQNDTLAHLKRKVAEKLYQQKFESNINTWLASLRKEAYIVLNNHEN